MSATETLTKPEGADFALTERAARRIADIIAAEGNPKLRLRIAVSGGGCSGFQYGFSLDDQRLSDDVGFERDGVEVLIDQTSLDFLRGSHLDYLEDLSGNVFRIENPNATSKCGCGSSFSV